MTKKSTLKFWDSNSPTDPGGLDVEENLAWVWGVDGSIDCLELMIRRHLEGRVL